MIQDLSGSWYIKGTGESTLVMDSPVLLMHHDPDRSWITDPNSDHPKGTQPHEPISAWEVYFRWLPGEIYPRNLQSTLSVSLCALSEESIFGRSFFS